MFWESKLEELQKLAPVIFKCPLRGRWTATFIASVKLEGQEEMHEPSAEGSTPAGALVELWSTIVHGTTPFTYQTDGPERFRVRFNSRWEKVGEEPISPTPSPVKSIEVMNIGGDFDPASFDPAD